MSLLLVEITIGTLIIAAVLALTAALIVWISRAEDAAKARTASAQPAETDTRALRTDSHSLPDPAPSRTMSAERSAGEPTRSAPTTRQREAVAA